MSQWTWRVAAAAKRSCTDAAAQTYDVTRLACDWIDSFTLPEGSDVASMIHIPDTQSGFSYQNQ